jgi:outer membrane protein OmpA-like peptidoglycan-associated protein
MKRKTRIALLTTGLIAATPFAALAQSARQGQAIATSDVLSQISMYSYRDGPESDLYFRGTPMSALAEGTAEVEYQDGNARISAKVEKLPAPASLGPYTVYVLWALTPDGRAVNQGVIAGSDGGRGGIDTEYGASQFALIVTAEPHFAVTVPSEMIALYNVADNVKGTESKVTTLTERSDYSSLTRQPVDEAIPTEIVQARYAYAIAGAAGAERFAPQAYRDANGKLMAAEAALAGNRRSERRMAPQLGREAVIASEDTRRAAMIEAAAAASETERLAAASAATNAANDRAAVDRESTRIRTEADRRRAADSAETARVRAADNAETARQQAAASAVSAARADLRNRLNAALPTRDSDRGLIAEIGGVQFATGKAELSPSARESTARFSGIVASYPELRFNIEGHTDSTGSVATNDALSLQRANAVRSLLISQGVPASSIVVAGFGSTNPTADNATADGRARNRRVEIIVSGGLLAAN